MDECVRVTKRGGTILLGVMSLWGSAHAFLPEIWGLPVELNRKIIETGDTVEGKHRCHMYRAGEFRSLLDRPELMLLAMSASNCLSTRFEESLAAIRHDEARWNDLLQMEARSLPRAGLPRHGHTHDRRGEETLSTSDQRMAALFLRWFCRRTGRATHHKNASAPSSRPMALTPKVALNPYASAR